MRIVGFYGREIKKDDKKEPVPVRDPMFCDFIRDTVARIIALRIESTEKGKPLTFNLRKKRIRRAVEHPSERLIALQEHMDLCVQTLDSCNG